jgi:endonuclease-3 related protein
MELITIYKKLLTHFGRQNWWPASFGFKPAGLEICTGAILTQNTSWQNVERALKNLKEAGCTTLDDFLKITEARLKKVIRPAGFFNQKAERLKLFAKYVSGFNSVEDFFRNVTREQLLEIKGIGPETADSILLYAANRPCFVIDAYTRRIFSRMGLIGENRDYEKVRSFFESNLPKDISLYKEFHALIVELGKNICRKKPLCVECPLGEGCSYNK